jgi:hypothetical protein
MIGIYNVFKILNIKMVLFLGWSTWTPWSSCSTSESCVFGNRQRNRTCSGTECEGDSFEIEPCTFCEEVGKYPGGILEEHTILASGYIFRSVSSDKATCLQMSQYISIKSNLRKMY